jgi:outer membrane protein OmpA-like peptidoglycan-associated protein
MKRVFVAFALAFLAGLSPAMAKGAKAAAPTLPAYFALPSNITIASEGGGRVNFEDFGESTFWEGPSGTEKEVTKQGKHWSAPLELKKPPAGIDGKGVWAVIKPSLVAAGWTIPQEYDSNPFSAMMRYQKDGHDVWGYVKIFGADDIRLNLVETGSSAAAFAIPPPAATPEKVDVKKQDFPYLLPLPGSKPGTGSLQTGPMEVTLPGSGEVQLVGTGYKTRFYPNLPTLSTLAFVTTYVDALTKAGWTIIESNRGSDAIVTAHYAKNGRDLWTYLHMGGEEYSIKVADAGADNDLAQQFAKDCHVALYGVLFDFNKASLKPESDPVLQRVLAFLQKDPSLKLEVQGHTDNVGGDDYNLKLSDARSKSVLTWLTQHGIKADRLSFKGYGKTRPVATNDTDEGRAKNRRVEIARPGCTK